MRTWKTRSVDRSCRELDTGALERVRGGTVVVSDPGPGDGKGPKASDPPTGPT